MQGSIEVICISINKNMNFDSHICLKFCKSEKIISISSRLISYHHITIQKQNPFIGFLSIYCFGLGGRRSDGRLSFSFPITRTRLLRVRRRNSSVMSARDEKSSFRVIFEFKNEWSIIADERCAEKWEEKKQRIKMPSIILNSDACVSSLSLSSCLITSS